MDLCTKKRKARVLFRQKRKENISLVESSILMQVKKFITKLSNESESENLIGIYWPLKDEVDLRSLKEISGLSLALPASKKKRRTYLPQVDQYHFKERCLWNTCSIRRASS